LGSSGGLGSAAPRPPIRSGGEAINPMTSRDDSPRTVQCEAIRPVALASMLVCIAPMPLGFVPNRKSWHGRCFDRSAQRRHSMRSIHIRSSVLACAALCSLACASEKSEAPGQVSVMLRATPSDGAGVVESTPEAAEIATRAVFTVDHIYLMPSDEQTSGRVVLREEPATLDLNGFDTQVAHLVDGAVVPAGQYSELRLVISGGFIDVQGSGLFATEDYPLPPDATVAGELRMPSFATSGLKIKLPDGALVGETGGQHLLRVDFDVAESFGHEAGASGAWVMHPVVRASDITFSSSLLLGVTLATDELRSTSPLAMSSTLVDHEGTLQARLSLVRSQDPPDRFSGAFEFLDPASSPFTIDVTANERNLATDPAVPMDVNLVSGESRTVELSANGFRE
jgi:hypothetical protein